MLILSSPKASFFIYFPPFTFVFLLSPFNLSIILRKYFLTKKKSRHWQIMQEKFLLVKFPPRKIIIIAMFHQILKVSSTKTTMWLGFLKLYGSFTFQQKKEIVFLRRENLLCIEIIFIFPSTCVKNSKYLYDEVVKEKKREIFFTLVNELCLCFQKNEMAVTISSLLSLQIHRTTSTFMTFLSALTFHILREIFSQSSQLNL